MSKQNQQSLSFFMKKQIKEANNKNQAKKSTAKTLDSTSKNEKKEGVEVENGEELTDEEKLEEAKKSSKHRAGQFDQTEMIKKMIIENVVKFTIMIGVLAVLSIAVIKTGPAILKFFNGLIFKAIIGGIGAK